MPESNITYAATCILRREDGAVLLQQRTAQQSFAGYWEFPGGKVMKNEHAADAARRELQEEVGLTITALRKFVRRQWIRDNGRKVVVDFFIVEKFEGTPQSCEGQKIQWAYLSDLPEPLLPANIEICRWLHLPPFCLITAAEHLGEKRMLSRIQSRLSANTNQHCIILRDKTLARRAAFAAKLRIICQAHGALLFAADDETLAAQMDGLHLSAKALLSCDLRPEFNWVGASCHNAEELTHAAKLGLDYALLSPVCRTKSHPDASPLGWERFATLSQESSLPIYALGGLGENDLLIAQQHNAYGVAFMRDVWD